MNVYSLLTKIPGVQPEMLDAAYWIERAGNPDAPLIAPEVIPLFNAQVYQTIGMTPVAAIADTLSAEEVHACINGYTAPTAAVYNGRGQLVDQDYFKELRANASPELPRIVPVRFGLITARTHLRTFPTWDVITSSPLDLATDLFQETAVDVGWGVAVVATSVDGGWYFCLTPHYWGWLPREKVTFTNRETMQQYTDSSEFVVTVSSQGLMGLEYGGGITPQMGTRFPLLEETTSYYRVRVPRQGDQQTLQFTEACIGKYAYTSKFNRGYLPCTVRHLLTLAFSLLGQRYAWGDSRLGIFGRDCSRLVRDVYAVTGVYLPRNADQQEAVSHQRVSFAPTMTAQERKALLVEQGRPGDMVVLPGHIMLYLGAIEGEPYVIHAKGGKQKCVLVSTLDMNEDEPSGSLGSNLSSVGGVSA